MLYTFQASYLYIYFFLSSCDMQNMRNLQICKQVMFDTFQVCYTDTTVNMNKAFPRMCGEVR